MFIFSILEGVLITWMWCSDTGNINIEGVITANHDHTIMSIIMFEVHLTTGRPSSL